MQHIIDLFSEKVRFHPDQIAVIDKEFQLTYKQLDDLSSSVAAHLKNLGVSQGDLIPIFMKPDPNLMITLLALYKIGASYLPISPKFPKDRAHFLIEDSGSHFLLTNIPQEVSHSLDTKSLMVVDVTTISSQLNDSFKVSYGELAYVIYTSGSTGRPKGVKVTHANLMHLVRNMQTYYPITPDDRYLLTTPYTFDVSVCELFGWISGSGALVTTSLESTTDYENLVPFIRKFSVSHVALSPSVLNMLLNILTKEDAAILNKHLKFLMIAGEEFNVNLAKRAAELLPDVQIDNLYGPTEATVYTTRYPIVNAHELHQFVPIGVELDNVVVKIYDVDGRELPDGETGELLIGGAGVASGYHNQPELSREKFITIGNMRFYRTGDQALRLPDGNIRFLGRNDDQVQINGIRIELGEIENTILERITAIRMVKVIYHNKKLYCYYVTDDPHLNRHMIRDILNGLLPTYMVPKIFIAKDRFPLTVNGKVNTRELLEDVGDSRPYTDTDSETFTSLEAQILQIFQEQLNVSNLRKNDRFFEHGADSLDSLSVLMRLERQFNVKLNSDFLYYCQTVQEVAKYLEQQNEQDDTDNVNSIVETNLQEAIQLIEQSFDENNNLLSIPVGEYDALYLQKTYVFDGFNSNVELEMTLPRSKTSKEIQDTINQLVTKAELLRSVLVRGTETLHFKEFDLSAALHFPVIRLQGPTDDQRDLVELVKDRLHQLLIENVTDHLMHHGVLLQTRTSYKLIWLFSHNIADQSNVHLIKKHLTNLLYEGQTDYAEYPRYRDFIAYINKQNDIEKVRQHDLTNAMREATQRRIEIEQSPDVMLLRYPKPQALKSIELITEINYVVAQLVCESTNSDQLAFSTLYNLRKFEGLDVTSQIGDYHTTLCFVGRLGETKQAFSQRMDELLHEYRQGFNPMAVIFNNYPVMTEHQQDLEAVFDLNPVVKTNYLGEVTSDQIVEVLTSLSKTKEKLSKFPVKKVYVTAFSQGSDVYIGFLSTPALRQNVLNRFQLEVLNMDALQKS